MIECKAGMAGYYRLVATNAKTGKQRVLADWFPNLITDAGLNYLGSRTDDNLDYCQVGSGSTAPTNADTGLAAFVAETNTTQAQSNGAQASPPYYGWRRVTKRFGEGVAAGNLTEVGMCADPLANGISLFSRALILDGGGNPTTVTVLANEFLDVTYELRLYPPLTDVVSTVNDGSTAYTVTTRAAMVTNSDWGMVGYGIYPTFGGFMDGGAAYDGAIGAITSSPSGVNDRHISLSVDGYSNNSLERTGSYYFGLNDANFNIQSFRWEIYGGGWYQCQFDPVIPKDNTKDLTIGVKVSWGRYVP
jgi:hypothetical protein